MGDILARGVVALTAVITVPLTLSYLGAERYGMWVTISSLIALLSFADLGIGSGLITAVARAVGEGDRRRLQLLATSGFWMLASVGALICLAGAAATALLNWAAVLNVETPLARSEASLSIFVFFVMFGLSLWLAAAGLVRRGLQEGYVNSAFAIGGSVAALAGIALVLVLRLGLPYLIIATMGGPLAGSALNMLHLYAHRPWLRPALPQLELPVARELLVSGSQFFALQLAVAAAFYADTVIASRVIGPTAAAEYAVVQKLFLLPSMVAAAALGSLWPAYGEAFARGDAAWVRRTLGRSLVLAIVVTVPASTILVILSDSLLQLWIGGALHPPALLILGMAIWVVLSGLGIAVGTFLNGVHLLSVQIVAHLAMAVANVTLSVYLAQRIGVAGVIIGTVVTYPLCALLPMLLYVPKALRGVATHAATLSSE